MSKDIEGAFGVLKLKWNILCMTSKFMYVDTMVDVMKCAIILNNIRVKEREYI